MQNLQQIKTIFGIVAVIAAVMVVRKCNSRSTTSGRGLLGSSDQAGETLNAAVDCMNSHDQRLHEIARSYSESLKGQPPGPDVPSIDSTDVKRCLEALKAASGGPEDLQNAMARYGNALTTVDPLLSAADTYYSQKNYKDDGFAKGRELHPKLIAAFDTFRAASAELDKVVDKHRMGRRDSQLAQLAEGGKNIMFYVAQFMQRSEDFVKLAQDERLEVAATTEAGDKAIKAFEELKAYEAGNKDQIKKDLFFSWDPGDFDGLSLQIKEATRAIRDHKQLPQTKGEDRRFGAFRAPDGSMEKLLDKYNEAVDESNRMKPR